MRRGRAVTIAVALMSLMATIGASPVMAADHSVQQTIRDKTGATAARMTAPRQADGISVGVGRSNGAALESYTQAPTGDFSATRVMAVLTDPSQTSVDFPMTLPAGARVIPNSKGDMAVVNGTDTIAGIEAPWAVDATGKSLPTSYTFARGVLTQNVDTSGAVFPVVADPSWLGISVVAGWYNGPVFYIQFNRAQTLWIHFNIWQGPVLGTIICWATGPAAAGCAIAFIYALHAIDVQANYANSVYHRCLKMRVPASNNVWSSYIYTVYC